MRKLLLTFSLAVLFITATQAQTNDAYSKELKKMFELSGSEETYKAVITQMMGMIKMQYSQVPAAVMNELEKEFLNTSMSDLAVELTPVYKKHLSLEDLKGLIAFYETPLGKKYAKKTPAIMQESMAVGQKWGMSIGTKFAETLKAKGY